MGTPWELDFGFHPASSTQPYLYPAFIQPAHPHPAAPHPHTQAPTPAPPHPTKKKFKKKLDTFLFAPIVHSRRDEAMPPFVTIDNRREEREQPSRANPSITNEPTTKTNGDTYVRIKHFFPPIGRSFHNHDINSDCRNRRNRFFRRIENAPLFRNPF